ncbi:glutaredoxin family protein [Aquincola sp. MAHUQ-54]|uniref:Glutaredoxin family protein n=1 Tax=Aquincola agrisoli TaxID=3119538 RepID=A0AAW9Q1Q2_9BURK
MSSRPSARSLLGLAVLLVAVSSASQWWRTHSQRQIGEALAAVARPGDIRLVSSVVCPYCAEARLWLQQQGVPFEECFIERDDACRATYEALMSPGTPMVLLADGRSLLGFDPRRVLLMLERTGAGAPVPLTAPRS